MKRLFWIVPVLLLACMSMVSCSESDDSVEEFVDWKARNEAFFNTKMDFALAAIAEAKRTYGDDWEAHCDWRTFLSYSLEPGTGTKRTDSICVEIVRRGTGVTQPLVTDSVRMNYRGRLIPSTSYADGMVFDHSGQYTDFDRVFDRASAAPVMFRVGSLARGIGTALLYMRKGDLWRVFVPSDLAYGRSGVQKVPGYSTLVFEMDLVEHYRAGTIPPVWS